MEGWRVEALAYIIGLFIGRQSLRPGRQKDPFVNRPGKGVFVDYIVYYFNNITLAIICAAGKYSLWPIQLF